MIRDTLIFKGHITLTELVKHLKLNDSERANVLVMLNKLQDNGVAKLNTETNTWSSDAVLSC